MTAAVADAECHVPWQVDYRERLYAVGRIPTSANRSEGAPRDREWLVMRSMDSALRPLLDVSASTDVQVTSQSCHHVCDNTAVSLLLCYACCPAS